MFTLFNNHLHLCILRHHDKCCPRLVSWHPCISLRHPRRYLQNSCLCSSVFTSPISHAHLCTCFHCGMCCPGGFHSNHCIFLSHPWFYVYKSCMWPSVFTLPITHVHECTLCHYDMFFLVGFMATIVHIWVIVIAVFAMWIQTSAVRTGAHDIHRFWLEHVVVNHEWEGTTCCV